MVYIPLHHKYRPQTFADLVGQEAISTTLTNALRLEKIAPAYLFTGPRGTGKTSSARILAKSLNCTIGMSPTAQPCGKCEVCSSIAVGTALDVIEIDAASNTGVDNIREIIERAQYAPVQCRYKVYIVDECLTGDSLVLTDRGLVRIDDRSLLGQKVLSYNDSQQQWQWKRVLRWLERGEKPTLVIKTSHREIRCTGNHLIGTDRGWIKAQDLKVGMKILSPVARSCNEQKPYGHCAPVDVAKNCQFLPIYDRVARYTASNLIGSSISTSKDTVCGNDARQNLLLTQLSSRQHNSDLSTVPCWEMVPSLTPTNIASSPDWLGRMASANKNGWSTKLVDCQNSDPSYKSSQTKDTASDRVPAKLPVIPSCQKSSILSNQPEASRLSRASGCNELLQKDLLGGISMMAPLPLVQKAAQRLTSIQKDTPWQRTKLSLDGLQTVDIQPKSCNITKEPIEIISTTTLDSTLLPVVNGWQIYNATPSHQWHTNLEEIESVSLAGIETVYDLEVEDNHNFVANGLLVHNCHMLTTAAFNSLLKTLEEPPPHVVFILATTDPQRVLPTIISRCQRFDYRRIPLAAMVGHLSEIAKLESIDITRPAISLVAQIAQGGLRDAESLLDRLSLLGGEITPDRVYETIGSVPERDLLDMLKAIATGDPEALLDRVRTILESGKEPLTVLQNLAGCYRDLTIAKTAPHRADLVALTAETWTELVEIATTWELSQILAGQQHLKDSETQLKQSTQPQLWLEIAILGTISIGIQPPAVREVPVPATIPLAVTPPPAERAIVTSQTPVSLPPAAPPPAPPAAPNPVNHPDLEEIWERVLQQLLPASKDLFKPFGKLIAISDNQAIVAMKSATMQTIASSKVPELTKVFSNMLGRSIAVKLDVIGKSQPVSAAPAPVKSAPATVPPPSAPPLPPQASPPPGVEAENPPAISPPAAAAISQPTAGEYLADDEFEEDDPEEDESIVEPSPKPDPEPEPAPAPQAIVAIPELEPEPEPSLEFAAPPDAWDRERAANLVEISDASEPELDPELDAAMDNIVQLFGAEEIDRDLDLFDRIVGT